MRALHVDTTELASLARWKRGETVAHHIVSLSNRLANGWRLSFDGHVHAAVRADIEIGLREVPTLAAQLEPVLDADGGPSLPDLAPHAAPVPADDHRTMVTCAAFAAVTAYLGSRDQWLQLAELITAAHGSVDPPASCVVDLPQLLGKKVSDGQREEVFGSDRSGRRFVYGILSDEETTRLLVDLQAEDANAFHDHLGAMFGLFRYHLGVLRADHADRAYAPLPERERIGEVVSWAGEWEDRPSQIYQLATSRIGLKRGRIRIPVAVRHLIAKRGAYIETPEALVEQALEFGTVEWSKVMRADVAAEPFPGGSFDEEVAELLVKAYEHNVLQLVGDDAGILKNLGKVLRASGERQQRVFGMAVAMYQPLKEACSDQAAQAFLSRLFRGRWPPAS